MSSCARTDNAHAQKSYLTFAQLIFSEMYDVITWLTKIAVHILTNISRSKGNQAIKFGPLIEHNMRNIFLEKSCTKCDRNSIIRPFSKKSNLSKSLDQYSKVSYSLFLWYAKLRTVKIY